MALTQKAAKAATHQDLAKQWRRSLRLAADLRSSHPSNGRSTGHWSPNLKDLGSETEARFGCHLWFVFLGLADPGGLFFVGYFFRFLGFNIFWHGEYVAAVFGLEPRFLGSYGSRRFDPVPSGSWTSGAIGFGCERDARKSRMPRND